MTQKASYLVDLAGIALSEEAGKPASSWVHALPIGSYSHPIFGNIKITLDRAKKFADSVVKQVRGIDASINYNHNNEDVAAGWVKSAEARDNGVWLFVEWTSDAAKKIKDKAYRYFSAEYADEWESPEGSKFADVIMGGALTNRPFMKNLVPLNLSEATVDNAFELVSAISGQNVESLKGGNEGMDEKDIDAIVEKVTAQLAEKFATAATTIPPATPANDGEKVDLSEVTELKALAEENPLVAALIRQVENQGVNIVDAQKKLHEQEIQVRLSEFDRSKLVLTPVAKKLVYTLLTELPRGQHETFWQLMENMRKSQAFLVDLSERSGVSVKYGMDRSPAKRFNELVNKELSAGVAYADAVTKVAADNHELYEEYRQETFN
jgi:hypothetical protein